MSDNQDNNENKEDNTSTQNSQDSASSTDSTSQKSEKQKKAPVARPQIGTPLNRPKIGTPIGTPTGQTPGAPAAPVSLPTTQPSPTTTAPARPRIGTPIGAPIGKPTAPTAAPQAAAKPPVTGATPRPTIGSPVGTRPTAGTPAAIGPAVSSAAAVARPSISSPSPGRPGAPVKKPESKEDISRRRFMKGLIGLGGLVAILQFGALGPFLEGTVGASKIVPQPITDSITSAPITTASFSNAVEWLTFVYPRTGNPNIDSDTFRQCVIIKLPKGFTAPASLSVTDSTGTYCAFSRVCVHLWCLWSYVPADMRMECPCHGSQYVPGSGTYPNLALADNQPPGLAVEGPASLQVAPNNQLPMITLKLGTDGSFTATGIVGQIGCGQKC